MRAVENFTVKRYVSLFVSFTSLLLSELFGFVREWRIAAMLEMQVLKNQKSTKKQSCPRGSVPSK